MYQTVVEDRQTGKFVCDGLEVIDATSGKIDIRAPMGVSGVACGWLIMPWWFYGGKGPEMLEKGGLDMGGKMDEDKVEYSLRRKLLTVAHAAMRSEAHRRNSHEVKSTHTIQNAARKLLQTSMMSASDLGIGSGSGSGAGPDPETTSFLSKVASGQERRRRSCPLAPSKCALVFWWVPAPCSQPPRVSSLCRR